MNFTIVVAFLLLTVPAFVTPGPNNLMLMASSAKFGALRTLPHMAGVNIGYPVMLFLIGLGLGEIFTSFPVLQSMLKYAAAAYFLWMAWHLLGLKVGEDSGAARPMRFFEAALFQWVNPKAWVISISFISAFMVPGENRMISLLLITLGCVLVGPVASITWIFFGKQLQMFLRRTGTEKFLGAILALLMLSAVVLFLI